MTATQKNYEIRHRLDNRGIALTFDEINTLRRASITLRRWAEQECGDGNALASWAIERDDVTGKPYRCVYPHQGESRRYPIPDRERGALRRIQAICDASGLHFYHQGDPRGCALYVDSQPIPDNNYTRAVAIY